MRSLTRRLALTGACALLVLPATTLTAVTTADAEPQAAPAAQAACSPSSALAKKLPNGTTWRRP
ncbi:MULTISPECIES: hypothetical protein [unclassified Streptomyces]|uniref:hypothetical protein n=1 Tax=unclassified Streptomyces TaxID=2593676 RepID=UPI002366AE8B|nr:MULTISPECIES: hypothetical protein [unclassified Streptomyces]MDF3139938.1 hypothetical protein [Streptomyces sp. T21Q-yed]WDF44023.1 hypothetical protein PBV52_48200 [Streptomyces sp. T12]